MISDCDACEGTGLTPENDGFETTCKECRGTGIDRTELLQAFGMDELFRRAERAVEERDEILGKVSKMERQLVLFRRTLKQIADTESGPTSIVGTNQPSPGRVEIVLEVTGTEQLRRLAADALTERAIR